MTLESTTNTDWFKAAENSRIEKAVRECMEGMSLADATMMSGLGQDWQQEIHDRCVASMTSIIKRLLLKDSMTVEELMVALSKHRKTFERRQSREIEQ